MIDHRNRKKKLIISYKNLTDEVRELFKEAYPDGYKDYLQKTIKPNGEPIFVVPLETPDTSYMIKFDVKIDTGLVEEDLDKDLYGSDDSDESEFAPMSEAMEKDEGEDNHRVGNLNHGAYEEMFDGLPEDKKEFEMANEDLDEFAASDDSDEKDDYTDEEPEEPDDVEPDDDELLDIETLLNEADSGEGMLREENPPEEKHGRTKKYVDPDLEAVKAVKAEVSIAKKSTRGRKPAAADADDAPKTTKTTTKKTAKDSAPTAPKAKKTTKK